MRTVGLCLLVIAWPLAGGAEPLIFIDFEQSTEIKAYPRLQVSNNVETRIVPGGPSGRGSCLQLTNRQADRYCGIHLQLNLPMQPNLVLSFDHKAEIEAGKKANYLGILFFGEKDNQWFGSDSFSDRWRSCEVSVADLLSPTQSTLTLETIFSRLHLYGRTDNETPARMTVWLDNIRLESRTPEAQLSDKTRTSYTALPFFHWARNLGEVRLEYAPDPDFPPAKTTSITTRRNWHLATQALAPGTWYWRLYRDNPLGQRYTPTERLQIPAEAHRYAGPQLPLAALRSRPYPRLVKLPAVTGAGREALVKRAESFYQQGVPDDPPRFAPGNPEWPTWIDWYGKVHGGITSRTGTRLQEMARIYVQTRDERVRDWLKAMALKAASWDPLGGSSLKGGDIGFHHLLRGLNWSYDALHEDLNETEREALRGMIIRRGELFFDYLNPFRMGSREYNNHSWLCAFALAESGLLLNGEYDPAPDWVQYAYDLYQGLFLSGLGYQGDNNEGIAYWGYGLMFVIDYADLMKEVCGVDLFQHPWLYQTGRFPLYTAPPGAWAVSFADTGKPNHGVRGPAATRQVHQLALRTRDPYALWYAGGTADEAGFTPKPPVDLPQSIHYRFIGWGIFNTSLLSGVEGVTVAMRSGPFWAGHQHEDQNSFVINAYGEKLAIDSGYYDWYGSEHFKKYSTLTRAHNAILVNGLDQNSRRPGCDGQIKTWFESPAFGYQVGEVANLAMYEGALKHWDRRLLFIKPGLVVVHDLLTANQGPARYDWLLHTVAPIETDEAAQSFRFTSGQAGLNGRFIAPADLDLKVVKGYPVEPVDGYSTRPVPPERYAHEWKLWATPRQQRETEDLLAVMQIQKHNTPPAAYERLMVRNGLGLAVKDEEGITAVLFRKPGNDPTVTTDGVTAQAEVAVIACATDGTPRRLLCLGGTRLTGAGLSLEADQPLDCAWVANELGEILTLQATRPTRVVLGLPLKGRPELPRGRGVTLKSAKGLWELQVEPGQHEILWPSTRPVARPGGEVKFTHHPLPVGTQATHYWWGEWVAPALGNYQINLKSATPITSLSLNSRPLDLSGPRSVWLKPGRHTLLLSGPATSPEVTFKQLPGEMQTTTMLPSSYRPAAGTVVIEAENVAAEGEIKGTIMEKVGASGKLAHCVWDHEGQWASWRFTVPQAGEYRLLIRGCSEHSEILRGLQINPDRTPQRHVLRLGSTGGWARTTDDWRYFAVPQTMPLTAGEHTLRLERLEGSLNLDCFVWEKQ